MSRGRSADRRSRVVICQASGKAGSSRAALCCARSDSSSWRWDYAAGDAAGPDGGQVTDFAFDQDSGLLAVGPELSAVDIISIKYVTTKYNRRFQYYGDNAGLGSGCYPAISHVADVFRGQRARDRDRQYQR